MFMRAVLAAAIAVASTSVHAQEETPPAQEDATPPPAPEPPEATPDPAPEATPEKRNHESPTPTPDEPQDVPRPPGYAPDKPTPFLTGPALWLVQLTAGLGARTLFGSLSWVPLLGLVAMLAAPLAEAAAITFAGDRVGPYRSSLFWPVVVSYIITALGTTATVVMWLMGVGIALPGLTLLVAASASPTLAYVGAGLLVAGALILVGGTMAWALSSVVSAVGSLIAYQVTRQPKHADDNGTDFPRLLPRGKGFPLPFLRGGEGGDDDEDEPPPGSTPVRYEVRQ